MAAGTPTAKTPLRLAAEVAASAASWRPRTVRYRTCQSDDAPSRGWGHAAAARPIPPPNPPRPRGPHATAPLGSRPPAAPPFQPRRSPINADRPPPPRRFNNSHTQEVARAPRHRRWHPAAAATPTSTRWPAPCVPAGGPRPRRACALTRARQLDAAAAVAATAAAPAPTAMAARRSPPGRLPPPVRTGCLAAAMHSPPGLRGGRQPAPACDRRGQPRAHGPRGHRDARTGYTTRRHIRAPVV